VLELTQPIPHLSKFSQKGEETLDELQEVCFALLTSLLFSKLPQVKKSIEPFVVKICE